MASRLVSVIIPTYNRAHCVQSAIDSVLSQSHPDVEVLVIDDGSGDSTRDTVETTYRGDDRVRYKYQENQGVSAARNRGLDLARGDYVALLDSDDVWKPFKLELQIACLEFLAQKNTGAEMIWSDMEAIGPDGQCVEIHHLRTMYGAYRWFTDSELFDQTYSVAEVAPRLAESARNAKLFVGDISSAMTAGNLVHTSTVVMTRRRLEQTGRFSTRFRHGGEDYGFHLRTCQAGPVAFLNVDTIAYQIGLADQLTAPASSIHLAKSFLETLEGNLANNGDRIQLRPSLIRQIRSDAHGWVGEECQLAGESALARRHLWRSLRLRPWQPRVAALFAASLMPQGVEQRLRRVLRSIKHRLK